MLTIKHSIMSTKEYIKNKQNQGATIYATSGNKSYHKKHQWVEKPIYELINDKDNESLKISLAEFIKLTGTDPVDTTGYTNPLTIQI